MLKIICDECRKPLDAPPLISVEGMVFVETQGNRGAKNLHFCDKKCFSSWLVKMAEKPNLVLPHAN